MARLQVNSAKPRPVQPTYRSFALSAGLLVGLLASTAAATPRPCAAVQRDLTEARQTRDGLRKSAQSGRERLDQLNAALRAIDASLASSSADDRVELAQRRAALVKELTSHRRVLDPIESQLRALTQDIKAAEFQLKSCGR